MGERKQKFPYAHYVIRLYYSKGNLIPDSLIATSGSWNIGEVGKEGQLPHKCSRIYVSSAVQYPTSRSLLGSVLRRSIDVLYKQEI